MTEESELFSQLGRISVATDLAGCEAALIDLARREFDPQSIVVARFQSQHVPTSLIRWIPDPRARRSFDEDYLTFGFLFDPFALKAERETGMSAYRIFEIAPDRFETSEYFRKYYNECRMIDEVGALHRVNADTVVHWSLGRVKGFPKYTRGDVRKFKSLCHAIMPKLAQLASVDVPDRQAPPSSGTLAEIYRSLSTDPQTRLSQREADVAALITQGHSSHSIAVNLGLSIHTVKVHRRNIYKKLSISSQNELFGLAMPKLASFQRRT
ncbi:helix-turn-helix transcriptional regulator [Ruegeria sp.]|uniref:helix-turn-helix transcriptional regulator n=1 Tax=Ruegeria sp. TaxID=1879320 RepID=UPI00231049AA|nr:helix-turn-helix transcriptional regulator [Ruegeria sp.]MDA7966503.1 helix-turn-helix transcriptional regulator [Ruegeria sp.]